MGMNRGPIEILRETEAEMRTLLAELADAQEPQTLVWVAGLVGGVAALRESAEASRPSSAVAETPAVYPQPPTAVEQHSKEEAAGEFGGGTAASALPSAAERRRQGDYPYFYRDRDTLVKIAWSAKKREEYEHRAPRDVLDRLVQILEREAGRMAPMSEVLKQMPAVSSFKPYLCIAWLQQQGLVWKSGHEGYSLAGGNDIRARVEAAWRLLPDRH